jgi:hypothetical protein
MREPERTADRGPQEGSGFTAGQIPSKYTETVCKNGWGLGPCVMQMSLKHAKKCLEEQAEWVKLICRKKARQRNEGRKGSKKRGGRERGRGVCLGG